MTWTQENDLVPLTQEEQHLTNEYISVPAMIMAIRSMKKNSAPGKSGLLTSHLKQFVQTECTYQNTQKWNTSKKRSYGNATYNTPLDYSYTAIPKYNLPDKFISPVLKVLLKILNSCIHMRKIPSLWGQELLITIPKPGLDPRYLSNTRGITLSCTENKLFMTIIGQYLNQSLEKNNFFNKAQAGFCSKQEATAQVVSFSKIIRRQTIANIPTFCLYVDFKKTFNNVSHEGIWAKLEDLKINSKIIEILRFSYDNASITCVAGNYQSKAFPRQLGTRQGCLLSPLLFNIYINNVLKDTVKGIEVPGSCTQLMIEELEQQKKTSTRVFWYHQYEFGRTASFIHTSIDNHDITHGVYWLSLLRIGTLPTVKSRMQTLLHCNKECLLELNTCPECDDEWMHITLKCAAFKKERSRILEKVINCLLNCFKQIESSNNTYVTHQSDNASNNNPNVINNNEITSNLNNQKLNVENK
ncbi:hypothetical protein O181_064931 [Austropuccinia psidii MF-1]|uniref:Reverse transcriptase domain-containing protein n=1 Tax=Austropuccinia psidii MF-1 TaxID=1389203 RepID=A0A9Q3EUP7_9BASI|nr:hypothetical protein [Austropuccinia psidii MF-1]